MAILAHRAGGVNMAIAFLGGIMKTIIKEIGKELFSLTMVIIALTSINDNPFRSMVWLLLAILSELIAIKFKLERQNGSIPINWIGEKSMSSDMSNWPAGGIRDGLDNTGHKP